MSEAQPTGSPNEASAALGQALGAGLRLLKALLVVLVAAFVLSGWQTIETGEVALRLRLGQLERLPATPGADGIDVVRVFEPQAVFGFPRPIDEWIRISTRARQVRTGDAFWFRERASERGVPLTERAVPEGGLAPGRDGSLLTAGVALLHGRWVIEYRVAYDERDPARRRAPVLFALSIGSFDKADAWVRVLAEEALVAEVAGTAIDALWRGELDLDAVAARVQTALDEANSGLTITNVAPEATTPPLQTLAAFHAVSSALQERQQRIDYAERERTRRLSEAAGSGAPELVRRLEALDDAERNGTSVARAHAEAELGRLLTDAGERDRFGVSGLAAAEIAAAESDAVERERALSAAAEAVRRLGPRWTEERSLLRRLLLAEALETVIGQADTVLALPANGERTLMLDLERPAPEPPARDADATE